MVDRRRRVAERSREMWRDLADAMCEKELEPVEVHAERIRRAIVPLITSSYEDAVVRLEDLGALVLACAGTLRLSDVAAEQRWSRRCPPGSRWPPMIDEDWLVLSTVHSAKGLEFDAVHVIHAPTATFLRTCRWVRPKGSRRTSSLLRRDHARTQEPRGLRTARYHHNEFVMITLGPSHRAS